MDRYGNLFIDVNIPQGGNRKWVNHSTMLAGQEVICAGRITIDRGRFTSIDNFSGHYRATRQHLIRCVQALEEDGADLDWMEVVCMRYTSDGHEYEDTWDCWATFLNPSSRPTQTVQVR
jgi:hypothetical protein